MEELIYISGIAENAVKRNPYHCIIIVNMKTKAAPYVFLLILALLAFFLARRNQSIEDDISSTPKNKSTTNTSNEVNRNRGFDRRVSYIEYTAHGRCRMQCRKISQAEVKEVMQRGKINYNKSDVKAKPCPEYALEGTTSDNQRVRIVFAQCDTKSKVITVIDLNKEWTCDCP